MDVARYTPGTHAGSLACPRRNAKYFHPQPGVLYEARFSHMIRRLKIGRASENCSPTWSSEASSAVFLARNQAGARHAFAVTFALFCADGRLPSRALLGGKPQTADQFPLEDVVGGGEHTRFA